MIPISLGVGDLEKEKGVKAYEQYRTSSFRLRESGLFLVPSVQSIINFDKCYPVDSECVYQCAQLSPSTRHGYFMIQAMT